MKKQRTLPGATALSSIHGTTSIIIIIMLIARSELQMGTGNEFLNFSLIKK